MILLTGGTGFVGGHVAHALRERGEEVRALVRDRRAAARLESWGCEIVEGDMTRAGTLRAAVAGCDSVVHLVAIRQGSPQAFERVMVEGTRDLVAGAREAGVERFVLMSALGAEEHRDLVPYFRAKMAQEELVQASGIAWTIFRPSFVFGPGGGILQVFSRLVRLAPATPVIGSGEQRLQPIWADDVGAFFAEAVRKPEAANRVFELGGPDAVTWNEFWQRLRRALGVRRRPTVHVPFAFMRLNALVTERLPGNIPVTRDLMAMLEHVDNTCDMRPALEAFALPLVPLDEQLRRAT